MIDLVYFHDFEVELQKKKKNNRFIANDHRKWNFRIAVEIDETRRKINVDRAVCIRRLSEESCGYQRPEDNFVTI